MVCLGGVRLEVTMPGSTETFSFIPALVGGGTASRHISNVGIRVTVNSISHSMVDTGIHYSTLARNIVLVIF